MDEDSAFTDDFDILPDIVKSKLVFKPVNPGPLNLIKTGESKYFFNSCNNVNGDKINNSNLNEAIQTPSQILKNASGIVCSFQR